MEALRSIPDTVPPDNRTLGWHVLIWTADNMLQPDGPNAGQPWVYTPEQVRIILRWYEIDERGRFVRRRGTLRRMKGWGKDPFAASLAGVELCGPCRFGGWNADGTPRVIPHPAPWIQTAAVSKDQTRNTMTLFPGMFTPQAINDYKIDIGKEIIYARSGAARIEAVTSSPRALEGGRPSLVIANETHHWLANNDGLAMADAIRRNLGKSRDGAARVLEITNAHQPDEMSAAEMTYEAWRQGNSPDVYYDNLEVPAGVSVTDRAQIMEALTAARGDSTWLDVERLTAEILDPVTKEHVARRYYYNQVTEAKDGAYIPLDVWDELADPDRIVKARTKIIIGFDGSFNNDSTGIVGCTIEPVPHLFVVECWEKALDERDPDWYVPIEDVENVLRETNKAYRVRENAADPYRWARSLQVLQNERMKILEFPQRAERMIPATTLLREAVLNRQVTHSGDPRLRRHLSNAVVKTDSRGDQIAKETKGSLRKIDLAVCAVIAFSRAKYHQKARRGVVDMAELLANAESRD